MSNLLYWVKGLGIAIGSAIAFSCNSAIATFNHCGIESGSNLFVFVPTVSIAYFNNSTSLNIDSSLVASTVKSLNFADGTRFSATVSQQNLNNSNFGEIFQNYDVSGDEVIKYQTSMDLTKMQVKDMDYSLTRDQHILYLACWCEDEGNCDCH